jgi:hypothetical protein
VDGFVQERAYQRPLRLLGKPGLLGAEPYPGDGATAHPRYYSYDRLTEANLSIRTKMVDVYVGRTIVPNAFQATVDGVAGSVAIGSWGRLSGWAGLMQDLWHPRLWLDRDLRNGGNFLPAEADNAQLVNTDPLGNYATGVGRDPLKLIKDPLNNQTLFNLHYATVGAAFSTRFGRFTSDTSTQVIFWNPTSTFALGADNALPSSPEALGLGQDTPVKLLDAVLLNHLMTFKPFRPLSFHVRGSWDAWGALRALDFTRTSPDGNPAGALKDPIGLMDPLMDSSFGLRELLADATFRGDWPFGLSAQFHHYQSLMTAQSYRYYQSDLIMPGANDQFSAAQDRVNDQGQPAGRPGSKMLSILDSKRWNRSALGVVQRERLRVSGWVNPFGFLWEDSTAQLYADASVEWRRDYPKLRPETGASCTLDKNSDGVAEDYYRREDCRVCMAQRKDASGQVVTDSQGKPVYVLAYGSACGDAGGDRIAPQDDYIRVSATVGLRDPSINDAFTYDISVTAMDSWSNRAVIARARMGAQAFNQLYMDMGISYEMSLNQRYYTSDVAYNASGAGSVVNGYYPRTATGQSFVFDANVLFRVAYGLTFEGSYLMFFEEAPNIQDYIFGYNARLGNDANAPAGVLGYIPRDQFQGTQMFLLRASYRL